MSEEIQGVAQGSYGFPESILQRKGAYTLNVRSAGRDAALDAVKLIDNTSPADALEQLAYIDSPKPRTVAEELKRRLFSTRNRTNC